MRRQVIITIVAGLACSLTAAGGNEALKTRPFAYHEDFEGANDPVQFLSARGSNTVHFKGTTDEKAFSGKKSFKLDVTLKAGGAYQLAIPLDDIPIGDNLKFSGMVLVKECLPRSRCVLGLDFRFLPCMPEASGGRSFPWNVQCDDWAKIYADIPDRARALARKTFPYQFWAIEPAAGPGNTANYAHRIFINLFTRDAGDMERRFVVYIDDLKIEGEVADKEEFKQDAEKRWEQVRAKTNKKIDAWESILVKAEGELAGLTGLSGEAAKCKDELDKKLKENDVRKTGAIQEARKKGWLTADAYQKLEAFYNDLENRYVPNIKELSRPDTAQRLNDKKHVVYAVDTTITPADWVLPDTALLPGKISDEIEITACPGEYEPASFVVRGLADIKALKVAAGELSGPGGKISPAAIDIKVLKCWYQDNFGTRTLTPELLLNDENLVKVDHEKKLSRIKFKLPQGDKYLCAEDPEYPKSVSRGAPLPADYPTWVANDSATLLPVDIAANENKQFWVTAHVPEDAQAGDYTGTISLSADSKLLGEVKLRLKVLPIKLSVPYYQASIFGSYNDLGAPSLYYQGKLYPSGYSMIEKRYRSELKDQVAHGITVPSSFLSDGAGADFMGPTFHKETLERALRIRNELGPETDRTLLGASHLIHRGLGIVSHKGNTSITVSPETKKRFLEEFAEYLKIVKSYGMKEVYFHLADERDGKELEAWLPVFEIVHQAGGKVITCLQIGNSFEMVGGITDLFFCENGIAKREADKWHSKGTKIWPVWNPTGGQENSDLSRRNHGLLVWATKCDGVTEVWYSLDQGWIEAASGKTGLGGDGAQNLVYRTTDGIIDTLQWEGYREAIDDVRYVTTLEKAIKAARQSGDAKKGGIASEAEKYLTEIDVEYGNLDEIRGRVIEYILKLDSKGGSG